MIIKTRYRINWLGKIILQVLIRSDMLDNPSHCIWRDAKIEDFSEMEYANRET